MKPCSYLIVLLNRAARTKQVGRLGRVRFEPGFYIYVGSGGVNVLARIRRHMRKDKPLRWHIDYLTAGPRRMRTADAVLLPGKQECDLAKELSRYLGRVRGFGASDCRCGSHLFYARDIEELRRTIRALLPSGAARY